MKSVFENVISCCLLIGVEITSLWIEIAEDFEMRKYLKLFTHPGKESYLLSNLGWANSDEL